MFDLLLWHMIACGCCCRRKFFQSVGLYIAISITSVVVALSSFVALVRAYQTEGEDGSSTTASPAIGFQFTNSTSAGTTSEEGYYSPINFGDGEPDFQFLWGYLVELFASLFVYTPLVQTLLFTGFLGCGVMPFFGGRPREVRREKAHQQQLRNSKKVTLKATDGADGKV